MTVGCPSGSHGIHPNVTLAVPALGGHGLRDAQLGGDPRAADDPARASAPPRPASPGCSPATCSSASVGTPIIGRLGDMYGKERLLLLDARHPRRSARCSAAVSTRWAVLIAARVIQGVGGGIFPLAFGIVRDEFPREKVAGSIGLLSAILGIGGGIGIVLGGADRRAPRLPLAVLDPARRDRRRRVRAPGGSSPSRRSASPGRINWLAGRADDRSASAAVLLAISADDRRGAGARRRRSACSPSALAFIAAWVAVEVRSENR